MLRKKRVVKNVEIDLLETSISVEVSKARISFK